MSKRSEITKSTLLGVTVCIWLRFATLSIPFLISRSLKSMRLRTSALTVVTLELQPRELLKCLWHSENNYLLTSKCGMLLISHITGKCPDGGGPMWDRPHLLQSETKETHVLHLTVNYITLVSICRKKRSRSVHRTRSRSQKEIRRELRSMPKRTHIPSGQCFPLHGWWESHVSIDPTLQLNTGLPSHSFC